jgi:hypothetical protein
VEFCEHHLEQMRKIGQSCSEIAVLRQRADQCEEQIGQINETIFGLGGRETLKSRLQRAEDAVSGLEAKVLENRQLVGEKIDALGKGIVKMVVILISIATVVVGGMFGLLWGEIKTTQATYQVNR